VVRIEGARPAAAPFEQFDEVRIAVRGPDGTVTHPCVLVASTEAGRERGLMYVTDRSLDAHAGMLFAFPVDSTGTFTMAHTEIPLTVVFFDEAGRVVSTTAMRPCPSGQGCPDYPAKAPFRWALEVPTGQLAAAGLAGDPASARLSVGGSCPTVTTTGA
jgi:uncharacterized membrane protein (UPF0127 family)